MEGQDDNGATHVSVEKVARRRRRLHEEKKKKRKSCDKRGGSHVTRVEEVM